MSKARKVSRIFEGELKSDELTLADGSGTVQSQKDANVELAKMIQDISDGSGNHDHDGDYSPVGHSHDDKSDKGHDHDGDYAKKVHGHSDLAPIAHDHAEYKTVKDSDQADADLEKKINDHATSGHAFLPLSGGDMKNGAKVSFPSDSGTIEGLSKAASDSSPVRLKEFKEYQDTAGGSYDDQWVKDGFATEKRERQEADRVLDEGKADKDHDHPDPPLPDHSHPHDHDTTYAKKVHGHTEFSPVLHDHDEYKLASEANSEIGALESSLTAEVSARKDGDDALGKRIDALEPFDDSDLQEALDLKFDKAGGDLASGGAFIGTNRLKPQGAGANTLYEGTAYSHPQALINSGMMKEYAAEKDHEHEAIEIPDVPPPVHVGDDPPEDPEEGDLWYDTNRLEMFIRYEDGWVTTNALGARIEAGEEIQRDLQARVAAGEAEQEKLQHKVNALEGSTGTHPYIISDHSNPREGQVVPTTEQSHVTNDVHSVGYLAFSLKDANGRDVEMDRAQGDDMIRFTDQYGNIVEYQIDGGHYEGFFLIAGLLHSEFDTFEVGQAYDVSWHSRFDPSGLATIKYVDQRDATKVGLSGENVVDASWRLKNGGATIFSTATSGKIKIYNLEAPTNWSHAANKDYVDDHVAPTWHYKRSPANSYSEKDLYWVDANETTRQFSISGVPMLGRRIQMINGLNSAEGAPRELMTISGKKNGKQVFLAIAPVRSWTMTSSIIVLRVNKADMLHWDPDAFNNDDPVTVKFGGLF